MKRVLILLALFCLGASTQSGVIVDNPVKYPGQTQKNYFVTPTALGSGDCLSWENACVFRTAVAKLNSSYTTTIYLSAGIHDTNNGSDATGTTISTNYVHITGAQPSTPSPVTRLVNKHAAATHVLRITGTYNYISDIAFGQSDQTDTNVIMLNLRANYNEVSTCSFTNAATDGGGTGILVDNSAAATFIHDNSFYGVLTSGIELAASTDCLLSKNNFYAGGKGIYLSSASADRHIIQESEFLGLTTAIDYATAVGKQLYVLRDYFGNCTTNISDVASWGNGLWVESITESGSHRNVYPNLVSQAATGVTVTTGNSNFTYGAAVTQIIPTATINKPIRIQSINAITWNQDSNVYQIALYYGDTSGTTLIGVYVLPCGAAANNNRTSVSVALDVWIPARSYVGVNAASSTGNKTITLSLGYEAL